jgi:hypothetical protein
MNINLTEIIYRFLNLFRWDLPPLRAMCFLVSDAWVGRIEAICGLEAQRHRWKLLSLGMVCGSSTLSSPNLPS